MPPRHLQVRRYEPQLEKVVLEDVDGHPNLSLRIAVESDGKALLNVSNPDSGPVTVSFPIGTLTDPEQIEFFRGDVDLNRVDGSVAEGKPGVDKVTVQVDSGELHWQVGHNTFYVRDGMVDGVVGSPGDECSYWHFHS